MTNELKTYSNLFSDSANHSATTHCPESKTQFSLTGTYHFCSNCQTNEWDVYLHASPRRWLCSCQHHLCYMLHFSVTLRQQKLSHNCPVRALHAFTLCLTTASIYKPRDKWSICIVFVWGCVCTYMGLCHKPPGGIVYSIMQPRKLP